MSPHFFSLQPQPQAQGPKVTSLAQLHKRPAMGLRLDFDEGSEHVSSTSSASPSCLLADELAAQRDQHRNEMDRLTSCLPALEPEPSSPNAQELRRPTMAAAST